jgi:hypothetical protein
VLAEIAVCEPSPILVVVIDCKAAVSLRMMRAGSASDSVMAQLAAQFERIGAENLRGKKTVLRAELRGEVLAPSADLFTVLLEKAAASIFEPTSQITVPCNAGPELFVPWAPTYNSVVFEGIGIFLGIVIRTGRAQKLPFAPVFWRYLAGQDITADSIIEADNTLKRLRDGESEIEEGRSWEVRNWSGKMEPLPGHADDPAVLDMNFYVDECVSFKAKELRPFLHAIRKGFRANVGFARHSALTTDLLRDLAAGQQFAH